MSTGEKHSLRSSEREEYIEYILLAELCSYGWQNDRFVEVARAQTDAFGYDLVLSAEGYTRHVQLKASIESGKARSQKINRGLERKASACVIWMKVHPDTLRPLLFGWFGDLPGKPLPDLGQRRAKHTKGNADGKKLERPNLREVAWSSFEELKSTAEVFDRLFGPKLGE